MSKTNDASTTAQSVDSNPFTAQTGTKNVPSSPSTVNGAIILLEPMMKDLVIVKVDHVKTADTEFIAITARDGNKIVPITCSISKFEKMGIAAILPVGLVEPVAAMVGLSEIPNDGALYGYKTKSGDIVAYERQGRYQLSNVYSVNNPIDNAFKALYGKTWNFATATAEEHEFYRAMLMQKLGR